MYDSRITPRRAVRSALLAVSFLLSVLLTYSSHAQYEIDYITSTETKPEVQAMRTVDSQFGLLDGSWKIYVDTSEEDYNTIAGIVKSGIKTATGYDLTVAALSSRNDTYDQIVIGDVSSDSISAIAARYQRNTIGLGEEGYNLISLPNAGSGKWLVVIAANEVAGARHGAYTLLDLIESAPDTLRNVRIRDYPDSPHREVQHWLPSIPKNDTGAQAWLEAREADFDSMGAWGANIVSLGRGNFHQMGVTPQDSGATQPYGYWLHQATDYARSRGVEPSVDIVRPPSGHWEEREGWYVDREPFTIDSTLSLKPLYEFQNGEFNMSFDALNASGWPELWVRPDTSDPDWGEPNGWNKVNGGDGDIHIRLDQTLGQRARIRQVIHRSPSQPNPGLQGFSLYVLTVRFREVKWDDHPLGNDDPNLAVRVIGHLPEGCLEVPLMPSPPYGENVVDLTAWAASAWDSAYFKTFDVRRTDTLQTVDFYFWTPPDSQQALAPEFAGFSCPYFEQLDWIAIQIETLPDQSPNRVANVEVEIEDLYLERRASALRNVMWWPGGDLAFEVTDAANTTTYTDTTFLHRPPVGIHDYWMETFPLGRDYPDVNRSVVTWTDPSAVGDTVYVSYTVGVPRDWDGAGGQATTYCLKSAELLDWHRGNFEEWFLGQNGFDPRFLTVRLDEYRGMNRCERGRKSPESNADHLVNYIMELQTRLDQVAIQDSAAADTRLIVYSQMVPNVAGTDKGYQLQWGGKYGATEAQTSQFQTLSGSNSRTVFPVDFKYRDQVRDDKAWPFSHSPGPNVSIIGWMIDDQPGPGKELQVPETADAPTWYESDARGFLAASEWYHDDAQTEEELRLLDYAWKRYRHPNANLHVRQDGFFATDSFLADTVYVAPFEVLEFEAFGSAEVRDPDLENQGISAATVTWGDGSPTEDVLERLNRDLLHHSWTSLTKQTYEVTLTVTSTDSQSETATIYVAVDPDDPDITRWSGTHELHEDYTVEAGKVLIVEPGTTVIADASVGITVHGALGVAGTAVNPVEFRASDTSDFGGWDGILVRDSVTTSSAVIDHCIYRNSSGGLGSRNLLTIRSSTIEDCEQLGFSIAGAGSTYASSVIVQNIVDDPPFEGECINLLQGARARFDNCTIQDAYYGALVYGQATMYANRSTFRNHEFGIFAQHTARIFLSDSCVVDSATYHGVQLLGNAKLAASDCTIQSSNDGVYLSGGAATVTLNGCTVRGNTIGLNIVGGGGAHSVSLNSCTFDGDTTGVYVGSGGHEVTITGCNFTNSVSEGIYCINGPDVTIIGNTVSGGLVGVKLDATTPVFNGNTIEDNSSGLHCANHSSPTLRRNVFTDNTTGISTMSGSSPLLDRCGGVCSGGCNDANSITARSGIRFANLDPAVMVDAECNYWDLGKGGAPDPSWFVGQVDYTPYLSTPPTQSAPFEARTNRLPTTYGLSENYPNPFNPITTIAYQVPPPGGMVSIQVYNVLGQRVATLVAERVAPGFYSTTWTGINTRGNQISSGMYFVQMRAQGFVQTRKLLLLK